MSHTTVLNFCLSGVLAGNNIELCASFYSDFVVAENVTKKAVGTKEEMLGQITASPANTLSEERTKK